jgi:hypothetical protein
MLSAFSMGRSLVQHQLEFVGYTGLASTIQPIGLPLQPLKSLGCSFGDSARFATEHCCE